MHPGVLSAALAYVCWGLFPLYFRLLGDIPALEVLVHRVIWSLAFVLLAIAARSQWGWVREVAAKPRMLATFAASATAAHCSGRSRSCSTVEPSSTLTSGVMK